MCMAGRGLAFKISMTDKTIISRLPFIDVAHLAVLVFKFKLVGEPRSESGLGIMIVRVGPGPAWPGIQSAQGPNSG
jgi:hypothetical protein